MRSQVAMATYLVALILVWEGLVEGLIVLPCDEHMFVKNVHERCLAAFNRSMELSQDSCPWPAMKGAYNHLTHCVEKEANMTWCKGWGFLVNEVFLEIHRKFFLLCGDQLLTDPPITTLIMFISPGIIVTLFLPLLCIHLVTAENEMPNQ